MAHVPCIYALVAAGKQSGRYRKTGNGKCLKGGWIPTGPIGINLLPDSETRVPT
jgi:hypothetical protein